MNLRVGFGARIGFGSCPHWDWGLLGLGLGDCRAQGILGIRLGRDYRPGEAVAPSQAMLNRSELAVDCDFSRVQPAALATHVLKEIPLAPLIFTSLGFTLLEFSTFSIDCARECIFTMRVQVLTNTFSSMFDFHCLSSWSHPSSTYLHKSTLIWELRWSK